MLDGSSNDMYNSRQFIFVADSERRQTRGWTLCENVHHPHPSRTRS